MSITGGKKLVKVVLRNPVTKQDYLDYDILPHDNQLAVDWIEALKSVLKSNLQLEKNFCFMGFPKTARTIDYLCTELNHNIKIINDFNLKNIWPKSYFIEEWFAPDVVRYGAEYPVDSVHYNYVGLSAKHGVLNRLHNHFEVLQGTVGDLSSYYMLADYETKYAIRQLNNLCHELESLILSQRQYQASRRWVRPSQITTFLNCPRLDLKPEHRQLFTVNGYDRVLGGVYMHWAQIGKTYFEVWRDESAPRLTETICEAITDLKYYSGEFDIEWGNDIVLGGPNPWHNEMIHEFNSWMRDNGRDPQNPDLSCGYLPIAQVDLKKSFGTSEGEVIWDILGNYLDIYSIEVDGVKQTYDYCWTDNQYRQWQIEQLKPGYDYSRKEYLNAMD
jgi:hypothetical protein